MFILSLNSGKNVQRYLCLVLRNKTLKLKIFFCTRSDPSTKYFKRFFIFKKFKQHNAFY